MERGTFFHLLGATGEEGEGGGPSKGLLFLPAKASKGSREKGGRGGQTRKVIPRVEKRGGKRERERVRWEGVGSTGRFTPFFGLLGSPRSTTADLSPASEKEEGGLLLRDRGRGWTVSRAPLCSTVRTRSFPWPSPPPPGTEKQ